MSWQAADLVKQQAPLHEYLASQHWHPVRRLTGGRLLGLCPLHRDRQPSFLVDPGKGLFYCYGCGRGGDVIRFVELYHGVRFSHAMALLRKSLPCAGFLKDATSFYQTQLHRYPEAVRYLHQRGIRDPQVIEELEIGYAPGNCLRPWLVTLGYALGDLQQAGLVNQTGRDTFHRRIVFPLEASLYGRSIGQAAAPHRFLPGAKGGLYRWQQVKHCSEVILVEGLFDFVSLWQAGFRNVTCSLGTHLNSLQLRQLCEQTDRVVYLAFDSDDNGSGQAAARHLSDYLAQQKVPAKIVALPPNQDPNTFFVGGGTACQFRHLLEQARP
jgi:DNA primase